MQRSPSAPVGASLCRRHRRRCLPSPPPPLPAACPAPACLLRSSLARSWLICTLLLPACLPAEKVPIRALPTAEQEYFDRAAAAASASTSHIFFKDLKLLAVRQRAPCRCLYCCWELRLGATLRAAPARARRGAGGAGRATPLLPTGLQHRSPSPADAPLTACLPPPPQHDDDSEEDEQHDAGSGSSGGNLAGLGALPSGSATSLDHLGERWGEAQGVAVN